MMETEHSVREDRRAHLAIAALIAFGVVLRLLTLRSPGFPSDVGTFQAWAEHLVEVGPGRFYSPDYFSDYPPAYLYILWFLGALFDGELLRLAVKAASIPADIAIAIAAAMLAWRHAGRGSAILAAGLWSMSPAAIFAGPYWGQVDAVGSLPLFAALVAAGRGRWAGRERNRHGRVADRASRRLLAWPAQDVAAGLRGPARQVEELGRQGGAGSPPTRQVLGRL